MTTYNAMPYLDGNFGPVTEEITAMDLALIGSIPSELDGRFVRNGPNPRTEPDMDKHHWFLGEGMVHGIRLGDGKARWYRNRYVAPADRTDIFGPNTHVIGHAGKTLAIVEGGPLPVELDDELNFLDTTNLGGLPSGFSAHPKLDPITGELHVAAYHWPDQVDKIHYVVVDAYGVVSKSIPIHAPKMPMIHDMALTQSYAAILDLPVAVNVEMAMQGYPFPFAWDREYESRVGLIPRTASSSNEIIWCDVDPIWVYHPMNSYDLDDGRVVIDVCEYDSMFDADRNGPLRDGPPRLSRWTVDPVSQKVTRETLDDQTQEFPRVSDAVATLPYRYGYTTGGDQESLDWFASTVKHDMDTQTSETRVHGSGREPGEPVFVPRDEATAEDDGWLMMYVYDRQRNGTDFVILDAQNICGEEVARVALPQRVPNGFHGSWIADA